MSYCGKCGAKIEEGSFCPNCGAKIEEETEKETVESAAEQTEYDGMVYPLKEKKDSGKMKKIIITAVAVLALVLFVPKFVPFCSEPCDWCGNSPTFAYKMSDGSEAHVCKSCTKTCMVCGAPAKEHHENAFHMEVFLCENCAAQVRSWNE